jgi:CheY-like chemotaxis protein
MKKRHVLVADDELNMLRTLEFILEVAGYKVTAVQNGEKALQKIVESENTSNAVELIITDIQMPSLNGLELIDKLNHLHIHIPIFVITAYGSKDLLNQLRNKGCVEYFDKPFDDDELVERVNSLFQKQLRKKVF